MTRALRAGAHNLRQVSSRNLLRIVAFDILAPLAAIAGLLMVGVVLAWPKWWVAACAVLVLLIVEGMLLDLRQPFRAAPTVGTDARQPWLRPVVVALSAASLVAAGWVGYDQWTQPDREHRSDKTEVVRIAGEVAEAAATISPLDPAASIERAAKLFAPDRAGFFRDKYSRAAADQALVGVSVEARTVAAGIEVIAPSAASVMVMLHSTRTTGDQPPKSATLAARVKLTKRGDDWLVLDVSPIRGH